MQNITVREIPGCAIAQIHSVVTHSLDDAFSDVLVEFFSVLCLKFLALAVQPPFSYMLVVVFERYWKIIVTVLHGYLIREHVVNMSIRYRHALGSVVGIYIVNLPKSLH